MGLNGLLTVAWVTAAVGPFITALAARLLFRVRRPIAAIVLSGLVAAFWILGVWAFIAEPASLTVRHITVESDRWSGPPLRIGIISDTHVAAPHVNVERMERIVARMNQQRPDIVMLLGDYAGGSEPAERRADPERSEILRGIEAFGGLQSPLGTYAVLGNHDSWFDDAAISQALARAGVRLLENDSVEVARPTGAFWVGGVADMDSRRMAASAPLTVAPVPDEAPLIVMTHWPDPFEQVPSRVALTLAGHTHCGQVNLPVLGRLIHASRGARRWACGLYDEGGRKLFVTGGVGVSILPVRFRAPPEIVLLTLKAPG